MGKEQEILRKSAGNMLQSIGRGDTPKTTPQVSMATSSAKLQGVARNVSAVEIAVERIIPDPNQPRKTFSENELDELGSSMKEQGQLQPIVVRWSETEQHYVIVTGERRWRAAKKAGIKTLKCTLADEQLNESQIRIIQLVENCLRENLNPLEMAKVFKVLVDENGWTERDLASRIHMNQSTVHRTLSLLLLPEAIQEKVATGALSASAAAEIAKVTDKAERQKLAEKVLTEGLTRDATAKVVREKTGRKPRLRKDEEATPRQSGTTIVYTVSLAKFSVSFPKQLVTTQDAIDAIKQLLAQLEAELAFKATRDEAA